MSSEFFCSLIRISCAQILRAAGIERFSPSLLDTLSDILIRYFTALSRKSSDYASLSGRNEVVIQDVALAMEEMGLIRPRSILDPYDLDKENIIGYENFIEWVKGPVPEEARRISRIPIEKDNGSASMGGITTISSEIITTLEKGNEIETSNTTNTTDGTTTSNPTSESTTTSNQTTINSIPNTASKTTSKSTTRPTTNSTTDSVTISTTNPDPNSSKTSRKEDEEWLTALMKKRIKVGNENKFKGTLLYDNPESTSETKIVGGPANLEDFQENITTIL